MSWTKDSQARLDRLQDRELGKQHDYLDHDECFGLARKCTWALADIGTPEARAGLDRLALSPHGMIAEFAQKRLDQWEKELQRKGTRQ